MSNLIMDGNSKGIQVLKPNTTEKVAISDTAAPATAVAAGIDVLRLVADVDCFYSTVGTATTSSVFLPATMIEFIGVRQGTILSVITASGSGSIYVTEMI